MRLSASTTRHIDGIQCGHRLAVLLLAVAAAIASGGSIAAQEPASSFDAIPSDDSPAEPVDGARAGNAEMQTSKLSFSFRFAPWEDVLTKFADVAGLTLDMTDVPTGTFNYYDKGHYSPHEALDILNGYLLQRGFVLVRRDRFLVCVNLEKGIPANLIPLVTVDQLADYGNNELVSVIFTGTDLDASLAASQLVQFQGPHGKVVALNATDSLLVTDTGGNLRLIQRLLDEGAYKRRAGVGTGPAFKSFALQYVRADDAERLIRELFGLSPAVPATSSPASSSVDLTITTDTRSNRLFVTASTAKLASIEQIVADYDVADAAPDRALQRDPRTTRILPIPNADAIIIGQVLGSLSPRIRVSTTRSARSAPATETLPQRSSADNPDGASPAEQRPQVQKAVTGNEGGRMLIDEVLLRRQLVDQAQLDLARQQLGGRRVDRVLVELGLIREEDFLPVLAEELGLRYVDLHDYEVDRELLAEFPTAAVFRHTMLPLERQNGRVLVAAGDPFDLEGIDELGALTGYELDVVLARRDQLVEKIRDNLGVGGDTIDELVSQRSLDVDHDAGQDNHESDELTEQALTASVVRLVNELLTEALCQQASDIHIEPQMNGLTIRYRIDGMLWVQAVAAEIRQFYAAIITRLKIMAKLNIAEKRLPQDGRMKLSVAGREFDVRVSIIPSLYGEGVVLRLLDKGQMVFNLDRVGMLPEVAEPFRKLISNPYGIVLVTGPTGHGKTTTLYSALNEIKDSATKIITIEDPVEYHTDGIMQIQVHTKIGLSFASGLRSILRHDPDVILVGEIRDRETAEIAIQSALTGHLVFSTLHSNDAASSLTRLIDMGIEPYLVASTVAGILGQRLIRVLCPTCKVAYHPTADDSPEDFPRPLPEQLWKASGCRECRNTGFLGRRAIFELLTTDDEIRRLTVRRSTATELRSHALGHGMTTLRQSGWKYVSAGTTSVDEVLRITKNDLV